MLATMCPMRHVDELPATVREYLRVIEEFTLTPIASMGPYWAETMIIRPEAMCG